VLLLILIGASAFMVLQDYDHLVIKINVEVSEGVAIKEHCGVFSALWSQFH